MGLTNSKVQREAEENFNGRFTVEIFAGTVVDYIRHVPKILFGQGVKIVAIGEEKRIRPWAFSLVLYSQGLRGYAKYIGAPMADSSFLNSESSEPLS